MRVTKITIFVELYYDRLYDERFDKKLKAILRKNNIFMNVKKRNFCLCLQAQSLER